MKIQSIPFAQIVPKSCYIGTDLISPRRFLCMKYLLTIAIAISFLPCSYAEDGYDLWLRYTRTSHPLLLKAYQQKLRSLHIEGSDATLKVASDELRTALLGITGVTLSAGTESGASIRIGLRKNFSKIPLKVSDQLKKMGPEGFVIYSHSLNGKYSVYIVGNTSKGVLYGSFHFIRLLQTQQSIDSLLIVEEPKLSLRLLNHWDNLNRTVERGYAGFSIWNWHSLPGFIDPRYVDYARANASIGINGTVLTNVNANATVLTTDYLKKTAALADCFRPYGIRVYLTARFSAPTEIGNLKTADPLDPEVQRWWADKAKEIYQLIPDFGGFLVKANSEGQPGPQTYGRTHAEGANMLAAALAPHGGLVIWRAFVYSNEVPEDRHKQAYSEFVPLDGKFSSNVMVQVKNGPIDFMPREPFHPLFGAMPKTPLMMEFQVTQEYLGQTSNLVYLAPLFKECLNSDTYSKGKGSTVANIISGKLDGHSLNGMAGVANIGNDINWCGHPFAQANWYALGRLSWNYDLSSEEIAREWVKQTFTNQPRFVESIVPMMMESRETVVSYSMPMGLHHLITYGSHYGSAPWIDKGARPDWTNVYYHKADSFGIGFDRTATGSNALGQYQPLARKNWEDAKTCDEKFLLWFHHVSWTEKFPSGKTLWEKLCEHYYDGQQKVTKMKETWEKQKALVDDRRFKQVAMYLAIQEEEAIWWRESCLLYFQTFSRLPIPDKYPAPKKTLDYYKQLKFPYAPGN